MHFGLFCLMTQREKDKSPRRIYEETVEHVRAAEDIGIEIAWFAEHHFSNYCLCPSPLTMAAYMAARTRTIRLGPAVIVAPLYDPVRLAEDIGMADQLSDGRLVLGFGSGYQAYEFHKFGRDLKKARDNLLEVLDFVQAYLTEDEFSFKGERIDFPATTFSVRPVQGEMPIYVAGMPRDPEIQRRAAERGYVPFFTTGWNRLDAVQEVRDAVRATYAAAGGDPERMPFAIQRYVHVTHDRQSAAKAADGARYVRRIAMAMRGNYGELDGAFLREMPAADEPPLEEIIERLPIGDPETVAERLARDVEGLDPTHISMFMGIPGLEQSEILKSIELFGAEVLPRLKARFAKVSAPPPTEVRGAGAIRRASSAAGLSPRGAS